MIEQLNKYREAKEASEQAARELGKSFGAAFELWFRNASESNLEQYDNLIMDNRPTITHLGQLFFMGDEFAGKAFGYLLKVHSDGTWTVGLHNSPVSEIEGSQSPLDEAPFVLGFIGGVNESRSGKTRPATVAMPSNVVPATGVPVA